MNKCVICGSPLDHRSWASHGHFFAELHDLYQTMPDSVTQRLNFDQFRKHALIRTGWRDEVSMPCATRAEAERWAQRIRSMGEDYAIVTVSGSTVTRWTAKSQSMKAMGKQDFQRSKDDVLGYARNLLDMREAA